MKILVVDDGVKTLEMLQANLENYGFTVETAINGAQAISKAETGSPDAVILDIKMPDMDGWQVCKTLKSNLLTKEIPIIFLTAFSKKEDFDRAKQLGAFLFLTKPVDLNGLAAILRHLAVPKYF